MPSMRTIRESLHLSSAFVAKQLNISEDALTAIEDGTQEATSDDLRKLSKLYGIPSDELLCGQTTNVVNLSRYDLPKLSDIDKKAIQNVMHFQTRYRDSLC